MHDEHAAAASTPERSVEEIVRAAYEKFSRDKCSREAMKLSFGEDDGCRRTARKDATL